MINEKKFISPFIHIFHSFRFCLSPFLYKIRLSFFFQYDNTSKIFTCKRSHTLLYFQLFASSSFLVQKNSALSEYEVSNNH